jgi:HSP20 family protein
MGLLPWRPFREIERLTRDIEERFPRFFGEWPFEGIGGRELFPLVESYVQNGNLVVKADVPGVDAKDVEVNVLGNVLTIRGERKQKEEIKEHDYVRREISYGSFERRMTLPEGAMSDKVKAQFKDGVVEVTVPLAKEIGAKKVPLEVKGQKAAKK